MPLTLCECSQEQALNPRNTVTNKRVREIDGNTSRMWRLAKPASKSPFKPTLDQSGIEHQSMRLKEEKKVSGILIKLYVCSILAIKERVRSPLLAPGINREIKCPYS